MEFKSRRLIIPPERVRRMLTRLSYEIVERNRGAETVELVGIRRRGAAVAAQLAEEIGKIQNREMTVHQLDVSKYRDDRTSAESDEDTSDIKVDITERDVVLVDDVLFTGRTARAALDALVHFGRPKTIQLVVLVDRGHREYPIQPDFHGRYLQTKHKERVFVDVEGDFGIYIEE